MGPIGVLALLAAWLVGWPIAVLILGLPAPLAVLAWVAGLAVAGLLAWRARDPARRSDPVSRVEARQLAKARFEEARRRRTREDRASIVRRRELEAQERVEARVRELVERRAKATGSEDDDSRDGDALAT